MSVLGTWQSRQARTRQSFAMYKSLLASPAATTLTLPATADFAVVPRSNTAGAVALSLVASRSRNISVDAATAGERKRIGTLEAGAVVTMSAGFDLYVHKGLGVYKKVITGP